MFITKCKITKKSEFEDSYYIDYEKYKSTGLKKVPYILDKNSIDKKFLKELDEDKEFFLLFQNKYDYDPVGISFNGVFFHPAKTLNNSNMTQKQKKLLPIANNNFKMNIFSIIHLSTFFSDDFVSFKYCSIGWLFSIMVGMSVFKQGFQDSSLSMIFVMLIMLITCLTITQARLWYNQLYLNVNRNKTFKNKNLISNDIVSNDIVSNDNIDISLLKNNKSKPTVDEKILIDNYLHDKFSHNPTAIIQLQYKFYDGNLSSKNIHQILEKI